MAISPSPQVPDLGFRNRESGIRGLLSTLLGLEPEGRSRFRAVEDHCSGFESLVSVAGGSGGLDGFPKTGMWHLEVEGSVAPVASLPKRGADTTWAVRDLCGSAARTISS